MLARELQNKSSPVSTAFLQNVSAAPQLGLSNLHASDLQLSSSPIRTACFMQCRFATTRPVAAGLPMCAVFAVVSAGEAESAGEASDDAQEKHRERAGRPRMNLVSVLPS